MAEHLSIDELKVLLSTYAVKIPIGSVWTHRKKPDVYYIICDLVIDEATDAIAVIYEQKVSWLRFVRLADIFLEQIEKTEYRWPRFVCLP